MEMRFYELNFLVPWGSGKVRPYFTIGGGVHTFHPVIPGYSSSTDSRATGTLGFGLKAFVTPNIGFRFEGKGGRPTSTAGTTTGSATTTATGTTTATASGT